MIYCNIINNSIEATSALAGTIKIEVIQHSGQLAVGIQDNGKGIPLNILERLGNEILTHGKETYKGNGLALFNARKDIAAANGTLDIFSTAANEPLATHKKTEVVIKLPLI